MERMIGGGNSVLSTTTTTTRLMVTMSVAERNDESGGCGKVVI